MFQMGYIYVIFSEICYILTRQLASFLFGCVTLISLSAQAFHL